MSPTLDLSADPQVSACPRAGREEIFETQAREIDRLRAQDDVSSVEILSIEDVTGSVQVRALVVPVEGDPGEVLIGPGGRSHSYPRNHE